ncbi:MAG: NTP transferase domain-containing protein [Zetaproteobacteria bacterium]|nr:NTP transferase domain-containing protein [Zetaproteobacteria bacterium]
MHIEHAIILAAGLGTRLAWLTKDRSKAMMNIQGEPAIIHVIRQLNRQGIRHIVINVHHHAQQLINNLGNGEHLGVHLEFSQEESLLDSGGGVRTAMQYLPEDQPFIVYNADIISDVNIQVLATHTEHHGCALALVHNPVHHPCGDFSYQHRFVQTDGEPRYTFAGISLWQHEALQHFPINQSFSLVQAMHEQIEKQACTGMLHQGQWFDIGRPRDLIRANKNWERS